MGMPMRRWWQGADEHSRGGAEVCHGVEPGLNLNVVLSPPLWCLPFYPRCCSAASAFNSARCGCNSAVLDLAAAYVGGDRGVYDKVSSAIASLCGFSKVC